MTAGPSDQEPSKQTASGQPSSEQAPSDREPSAQAPSEQTPSAQAPSEEPSDQEPSEEEGRPFLERAFGTRPRRLPLLLVPTVITIVIDYLVRGRLVVASTKSEWLVYLSGVLASTLTWGLIAWVLARLEGTGHRRAALAVTAVLVAPFAWLTFAAQIVYYRNAGTYASDNALTLAWRFRQSMAESMRELWPLFVPFSALALALVVGLVWLSRRLSVGLAHAQHHVPIMAFAGLFLLCGPDRTWMRDAGTLPPDASLIASVSGLLRQPPEPRGLTVRSPLPVPPLTPVRRRNVVLVLTESVRADVMPSVRDPARPSALDEVIGDRMSIGLMTSQASSTVVSCVATWTGLSPVVDLVTAHQAPVLFEIAKAAGYHTAYIGAQRGDFHRIGGFLQKAGLDVHIQGEDLDRNIRDETGAPDDMATRRALDELRAHPEPTFLVLHLSSTHYPYRIDPALTPYQPITTLVSPEHITPLFNRYRDSVLLQERILRDFFRELRALPSFDETVVLFVSDHGEQFHEHGAFTHIRSFHDEEVRVPGFLVSGPRGLDDAQRQSLASYASRRVFNQDVSATLIDLLGVWDQRALIPLADRREGRSLVRPASPSEPVVLLANRNGIWETDHPTFGAMQGPMKVMSDGHAPFACYDTASDPGERTPLAGKACGQAYEVARRTFTFVPTP